MRGMLRRSRRNGGVGGGASGLGGVVEVALYRWNIWVDWVFKSTYYASLFVDMVIRGSMD